jgi:hypothetical protein
MNGAAGWMVSYGLQAVESVAVAAGLCFAAIGFLADARSRKAENLIRVTESHRTLWLYFSDHPELARILQREANLVSTPMTVSEERFVILLIAHVFTAFKTTQSHLKVRLEGQDDDIGELFSLPIPMAVWCRVRHLQDHDFVTYIEHCVQKWNRKRA